MHSRFPSIKARGRNRIHCTHFTAGEKFGVGGRAQIGWRLLSLAEFPLKRDIKPV